MILSRKALQLALAKEKLKITPFDEQQLDTAHVDLHLAAPDQKELILEPKGFAIAQTKEKIALSSDLCGFIEGRSRLAQQGVSIEQSSTFIEPETDSQLTLEIFNASNQPVTLQDGQAIAKMYLTKVVDSI